MIILSSRSATVLVIFIVACIAFCLASVFGAMTGPISILPDENDSGGILDNLSAITDSDNNYETYGSEENYDYSNDYNSYDSSQSSDSDVETTTDDSSQQPDQSQNDQGDYSGDNGGSSSEKGSSKQQSNSEVITTTDG